MKPWSRRFARWIVGALFIYAGASKAREPGALVQDIWNFRLVPEGAAYWLAAGLPYFELVAGVALVTGLQSRGGHVLATGLLLVFIAALASAWTRGLDISCGCFGAASTEAANYPLLLTRNMALLAALGWSALGFRENERRVPPRTP